MALFFDQDWFDARLARAHLTSEAVAAALGVDAEALAEIRKDQRELTPDQVATLATLLAEPVEEVVKRAGIATPTPAAASELSPDIKTQLARLEDRLARIEGKLDTLLAAHRDHP